MSNGDILYYSTSAGAGASLKSGMQTGFREALFAGQAPDKGLFMPDHLPEVSRGDMLGFRGKPYADVAYDILRRFLPGDISDNDLARIVKRAYDFDVPIEKLDDEIFLLRLDRGPTASFKDFAARIMAGLMEVLRPAGRDVVILVATSGDTGSAIGNAYHGLAGFRVFILYPDREVSEIQKQQLDAIGGNVVSIAVDGKFDDCQKLVKEAFSDPDLAAFNLTSANSINIGRIIPQIVYYFYAYANVVDGLERVIFSVPSGNFGNSFGCELARRMGLPVEKLIIATNANDEFPVFLETGAYRKVEPAKACLSNAMNVGNPSNLARYFDLFGGMLDRDGIVHADPDLSAMRKHLSSVSISDEETLRTMAEVYERYGVIVEPHGAVGLAALFKFDHCSRKSICLETAHPYKFAGLIKKELGVELPCPDSIRAVLNKRGKADFSGRSYAEFKSYLLARL